MPYRTNPNDPMAPLREREEIRLVAEEAKRRKRLATVGSLGCVIAVFGVFFELAPSSAHRECHRVAVRWENAPEIPPSVWTTCVQKP
jgi:hypothetical protein